MQGEKCDKISTNDDDNYKMSASPRGYCCLFLNKHFNDNNHRHKREGAEVDLTNLKSVFKQLNFEIYGDSVIMDLKSTEYESRLNEILDNELELEDHDAFVAIFSSHGNESAIYGSDCKQVMIRDIIDRFSNHNCPVLAGKPKIFVFLSCRGDKEPQSIKMNKTLQDDYIAIDKIEEISVPIFEDIIICYSTVNTYISLRHKLNGTYYGQYLANNLAKYAEQKDFLYILMKSANDMSNADIQGYKSELSDESITLKLMSSWRAIGWRKMLYFNPRDS